MNWFTRHNRRTTLLSVAIAMLALVPTLTYAFPGALTIGIPILEIAARIAGWAGLTLNWAVMELVFDMGGKITSNFGISMENAWGVVRDTMNLLFIFALIYIGFLVILDSGANQAKKLLPPLIIAALLVNFSLFFSKAIVDISNLMAVEIYSAMGFSAADEIKDDDLDTAEGAYINIGVSGAYMHIMGLKDLISPTKTVDEQAIAINEIFGEACSKSNDNWNCSSDVLVFFFAGAIFLIIAAYSFFVGAFMLVTRFITLIMLMIASPLMFAGMVFPKASRYTSQWWSKFLSSAFFAPAYFFLLYIGLSVGSKLGIADGGEDAMFLTAVGKYSTADLVLHLLVVCGFLIFAAMAGQQLGQAGGAASVKIGQNMARRARGMAQGAVTYPARYMGRNAVNKMGIGAEKAFDYAQRKGMVGTQNSAIDQFVRGQAQKAQKAKFGLSTTVSENRKTSAAIRQRQSRQADIDAGQEAEKKLAAGGTLTNAEKLALQKYRSTARDLSVKDLKSMTQEERKSLANSIDKSTFDKLVEDDELTDEEKGELYAARAEAIKSTLEHGGQMLTEKITELTIEQIEALGDEFIRANAEHFSNDQMDAIKKSKNFSPEQFSDYQAERKSKISSILNGTTPGRTPQSILEATKYDAASGTVTSTKRKSADIAQMPREVFIDPATGDVRPAIVDSLSSSDLEQIGVKGKLSPEDRQNIKLYLVAGGPGGAPIGSTGVVDYLNSPGGERYYGR